MLLTLGADRVARVWDAASGKHLHLLYPGAAAPIQATCFDAEGQVLTLCGDSTVRIWNTATGEEDQNVPLAPRLASRSLLVPSLASDTLLTDGWLGLQLRDARTGNIERLLRAN